MQACRKLTKVASAGAARPLVVGPRRAQPKQPFARTLEKNDYLAFPCPQPQLPARRLMRLPCARAIAVVIGSPQLFELDCRTPRQVQLANALCRFRELATNVRADAAR